jgi:hypothetical protein
MFYLRRLGRKHIDFEFSVNDEFRGRPIEVLHLGLILKLCRLLQRRDIAA